MRKNHIRDKRPSYMWMTLHLILKALSHLQSWLFSRDLRNAKDLLNTYTLGTTWEKNMKDEQKKRVKTTLQANPILQTEGPSILAETWTWPLKWDYCHCSVSQWPLYPSFQTFPTQVLLDQIPNSADHFLNSNWTYIEIFLVPLFLCKNKH